MAEIKASMVKELRDRTGLGMMECKKALVEAAGDMDAAIEQMRITGLAKADKKSSRVAAEGIKLEHGDDGFQVFHWQTTMLPTAQPAVVVVGELGGC